jgi:hypothetical protein
MNDLKQYSSSIDKYAERAVHVTRETWQVKYLSRTNKFYIRVVVYTQELKGQAKSRHGRFDLLHAKQEFVDNHLHRPRCTADPSVKVVSLNRRKTRYNNANYSIKELTIYKCYVLLNILGPFNEDFNKDSALRRTIILEDFFEAVYIPYASSKTDSIIC